MQNVFAQSGDGFVTKHVYKGWNLLGNGEDFPRPLMDKAQYILGYAPIVNKYFKIKPESPEEREKFQNEIKSVWPGGDLNKYEKYVRGSYWFYYPEAGDVSYRVGNIQKELFSMLAGWNFKYITWDMVGKNFNDITGNCNVKKAYTYDALKAEEGYTPWESLLGFYFDSQKGKDAVGHGMIINVEKDCQFSLKDTTPIIPQLPN